MDTTIANYKITPTKIETFDEIKSEKAYDTDSGNIFILIDFILNNIGAEAVEPDDVILEDAELTANKRLGVGFYFVDESEDYGYPKV